MASRKGDGLANLGQFAKVAQKLARITPLFPLGGGFPLGAENRVIWLKGLGPKKASPCVETLGDMEKFSGCCKEAFYPRGFSGKNLPGKQSVLL